MTSTAYSQVPEPRVVASPGVADPFDPDNVAEPVWETWVAADPNHVMIVHHQEVNASNNTATRIGYALLDRASGERIAHGVLSPPAQQYGLSGSFDPSVVAADDGSGDFLACAVLSRGPALSAERAIRIARFSDGSWGEWVALTEFESTATAGQVYDRPWLMAGGLYNGKREYYITFWQAADIDPDISPARHRYLRSTDGGETWTLGDITLGIGGDIVEFPGAAYQPAVAGDGPLYIAYEMSENSRWIRVLRGTDIDSGEHAGEVEFEPVYEVEYVPEGPGGSGQEDDPTPEPAPLTVGRNHTSQTFKDLLPGSDRWMQFVSLPWLAADPTDPNQLYLVYHDTATDDPNDTDLNVYLHGLRHHGLNYWSIGSRVQVNDAEPSTEESDQFLPTAVVDSSGRIHVIFYDDRDHTDDPNHPGVDGQPDTDDPNNGTPNPRFEVYYAYSEDGGDTWFNAKLAKDPEGNEPNEPCLNYTLFEESPGFDFSSKPGEYNGIAVYDDEAWTSFTGTSLLELEYPPKHTVGDLVVPDSVLSVGFSTRRTAAVTGRAEPAAREAFQCVDIFNLG